MKRREFVISLSAATLACPILARSQQKAMPVIGYLSQRSPADSASIVAAFRQGLKEAGFVDGQNAAIEARFAEGQIDRLPGLARDLVSRGVDVFVATGGTGSVVKARPVVPKTIPLVFAMGGDPVKLGIVASLARPGDNITGIAFLLSELAGANRVMLIPNGRCSRAAVVCANQLVSLKSKA
jgi:putative tryptophan/tyrosine transport system substrate-binding protein